MGFLFPTQVTKENQEELYLAINERIRKYFVERPVVPTNSKSVSRADDDFAKWMANADVEADITAFLNQLPDIPECNKIKDMVAGYRNLPTVMACDNSEQFTTEKLQSIKQSFDALVDGDAFHKALDDFNTATNYQYAKNNSWKALTNMSLRLDQAVSDFERLTIVTNNAQVQRASNSVGAVEDTIKEYDSHLKAQVYRLERSSDPVPMEEVPVAIALHKDSIETLEKSKMTERITYDQLIDDIIKKNDQVEQIRHGISVQKNSLEDITNDIKIRKQEIDLHNKKIEDEQGIIAQYNEENAKSDITINNLKNASAEDIVISGYTENPKIKKYQENATELEKVNYKQNVVSGLNGFSMKEIENAFKKEASTDKRESIIQNSIKIFSESYDKFSPDTVTEKTGFFSRSKTRAMTSKEFIEAKIAQHKNDPDSLEFIKDLKLANQKIETRLKAENAEIRKDSNFEKEAKSIREKRINNVELKKNANADLIKNHQKTIDDENAKLKKDQDILASYERSQKRTQDTLQDFRDSLDAVQSNIAKERAQADNIAKKMNDIDNNILSHRKTADELQGILDMNKEAEVLKQKCIDSLTHFRQNAPQATNLADNRSARIKDRLDSYINHHGDNKGWRGNSREYDDIAAKLRAAKESTPENLKQNITALEESVSEYIRAKGTRSIFTTERRHTRLNYARDIQSWCLSTLNDLGVKPTTVTPEMEKKINQLKNPALGMALIPNLNANMVMDIKKDKAKNVEQKALQNNKSVEKQQVINNPGLSNGH